jgi:hypothetical protein
VLGRPDWPLISFAAKKNYSMSNFYNTVFRPAIRKIGVRVGWYRRRKRKNESIPPDFDDLTLRVFEAVKDFTMTSPERVGALVQTVRFVVDHKIEGAIVECGVWRGGSAMAVDEYFQENNLRIFLSRIDYTGRIGIKPSGP